MTFKSRTPKKEERITPMKVIKFKNGKPITHCQDDETFSNQTKEMIDKMKGE